MAIKGSGNVTVTLARTTVAMLRAKKKDLETWDDLMLRLARRRRCSIECAICGTLLETRDPHVSPSVLAEINGWREVSCDDEKVKLGYVCASCGDRG